MRRIFSNIYAADKFLLCWNDKGICNGVLFLFLAKYVRKRIVTKNHRNLVQLYHIGLYCFLNIYFSFLNIISYFKQCESVGKTRCMKVYYEQLVLHPEGQIKRILQFLEIPWNNSVLHHEELVGKDISLSKWIIFSKIFVEFFIFYEVGLGIGTRCWVFILLLNSLCISW